MNLRQLVPSLAIALAVGVSCPVLAADEDETPDMKKVIAQCEKEAKDKPNPEEYLDKCIEEKASVAPESKD